MGSFKPVKLCVTSSGVGLLDQSKEETMKGDLKETMARLAGGETAFDLLKESLREKISMVEKNMASCTPAEQRDLMDCIKLYDMLEHTTTQLEKLLAADPRNTMFTMCLDGVLTILVSTLKAFADGPAELHQFSNSVFKSSCGVTTEEAINKIKSLGAEMKGDKTMH
jgi:hypothetical protein